MAYIYISRVAALSRESYFATVKFVNLINWYMRLHSVKIESIRQSDSRFLVAKQQAFSAEPILFSPTEKSF